MVWHPNSRFVFVQARRVQDLEQQQRRQRGLMAGLGPSLGDGGSKVCVLHCCVQLMSVAGGSPFGIPTECHPHVSVWLSISASLTLCTKSVHQPVQIRSKILELEAQLQEERRRLSQLHEAGSLPSSSAAAVSVSIGAAVTGYPAGGAPAGMAAAAIPGRTGHSHSSAAPGFPAVVSQQEQQLRAPPVGRNEAAAPPAALVAAPGVPAAGPPPARRGGLNITFTRRTGQPEGSPPGGNAALPSSSSAISGDTVSYQSASSSQPLDDDEATTSATSRCAIGTGVRAGGSGVAALAGGGGYGQHMQPAAGIQKQAPPVVIDLTDD